MPVFHHGSVELAYLDEGQGEPIVLVHGFASVKEVNWVQPGWVATLKGAGRRVIALDNRGHGQSSKLYDPADYHTTKMAGDVRALLDHLEHRARRCHGLFDGRADRGVPRARTSGPRALDGAGRARHAPDRWRGPAREHRRGAGGAVARRRHRSAGPHVPRLRRPDQIRPPRARRLHPRLAAGADPRAGGVDPDADADRGRHQGPDRGLGRGTGRAHAATPRRCRSPAATTCSRSATRCSRPACCNSFEENA